MTKQPIVPEYPYITPDLAPTCGVPVTSYLPTLRWLAKHGRGLYDAEQTERVRPLESTGLVTISSATDEMFEVSITRRGRAFHDNNWTVPRG